MPIPIEILETGPSRQSHRGDPDLGSDIAKATHIMGGGEQSR